MKETETIDEFAGKLSVMSSNFSTLGAMLEDSSLVKKLLDSVPNKFFSIVAGIEQFPHLETIPFEETIGRGATWTLRQEARDVGPAALVMANGVAMGGGAVVAVVRRAKTVQEALAATEPDTRHERQDTILPSEDRLLLEMYRGVNKGDKDVWYLDNGASNHMIGHREKFQELDETITRSVRFSDGSTIEIMETGNEVHMERDTMKVIDRSGKLLMLVKRTQNLLYKITLKTFKQLLGEKKLVVDVPPLAQLNKLCEVCVIAKHARSPFPCQANCRAEKTLELLHANICGPILLCTLVGNKYFLLIVDDFTRWVWVFILATKNDAFRAFKKFKFLMEKKTEYKIKTLRIDQGDEFLSTEFTQFYENEGIKRHLTAPYTPQQNGVVEHRNRTMMAMARSLLKGTHMPARL
ncbi:uncharacterized protein LOC122048290 [Zingiber officinale]|uniref:uncharacterized protein LOC122048290 n=1 Tax=Zingiber officinale TaxID=94328 RepID=UPI001C4AC250|nr:uncharacterized protein LOC122048290 [Zingiber officinale]